MHPSSTLGGLARQAVLLALVLGVFVSTTTTGALAIPWILEGAFVLSWIVVLQVVAVGTIARLAGSRASWPAVVRGYWSTHGAWIVLLLGLSVLAVCAPDHRVFHGFMRFGRLVLAAIFVAWAWSSARKAVFFHRELGLSKIRTALVLLALTVVHLATPIVFFVATRQLPVAVLRGYL